LEQLAPSRVLNKSFLAAGAEFSFFGIDGDGDLPPKTGIFPTHAKKLK
jgi:hypothetical protein